jgi:4-methylaminobutanoate oxidase (formaldehyde-forming)
VTFLHVDADRFLLVTGSGFGVRDSAWVRRHLPDTIAMRDVTGAYATLNICGPRARDILSLVTDDDVSNEGLGFFRVKTIEVGFARVLAARLGYVGELGYELYIPQEYAAHVYDILWEAGKPFGIANAGYRAIESCRLEKGYLYWSTDITPDLNPYEAGLGFCVSLGKGDFIGRDALQRIKAEGVRQTLCTFVVEDFAPFHGGETILLDGKVIGRTTSTGYGHSVAKTIAFGYLPADVAKHTHFEIEAFGRSYPARRVPRCLYDPQMARLKV